MFLRQKTSFGLTGSAGEVLVQYEKQLSSGGLGSLWLGRLASGSESGRLVTVRRIATQLLEPAELDRLMHIAGVFSRLKSPSLVKLLGAIREDTELLCISEYLAGVRFLDLQRFVIESENPIPASVATRLILEVARSSVVAHRLMSGLGILTSQRVIFADSVLIALFGEILLTDVGVVSDLLRCPKVASIPAVIADLAPEEIQTTASNCGSPEVFTLGVWLWELLTGRWLFPRQLDAESCRRAVTDLPISRIDSMERMGMPVPEPLVRLLEQTLDRDPRQRIGSLESLLEALEQLPSQCIATSEQLGDWIRSVAPQILPDNDTSAVWPLDGERRLVFSKSDPPMTLGPLESHNWDPPTFSERQLIAPVVGLARVEEPPRESLSPVLAVSVPVSRRVIYPRRKWKGALVGAIAVVIVLASSVLLLTRRAKPERAQAKAEPTYVAPESVGKAVSTGDPAMAGEAAPAKPSEPAPATASASTQVQDKHKNSGGTAIKALPKMAEPEPSPETTARGSYRPRKISPYHPKGI